VRLSNACTFVDLTHTLMPKIPSWGGTCGFEHVIAHDYDAHTVDVKFRTHHITMQVGMGTHMDAPVHCIPGGLSIADLPLEKLIAPCVMIDVSSQAHEAYSLSVQDIETFEMQHGVIAPGCLVIIYTGWDRFWPTSERYRNNLAFPSIHKDTAAMLLEKGIVGLGIDTLSPDRPESGFPVHQLVLGAGKYIIENIANAAKLPPVGAYTLALPIKIQDGTEAPVRLVGMITNC
jgi:kynurenine formamidase